MYASNSHSYTHLILALGIVRKPTVWVFITSKYPGTHDIGLPNHRFEDGGRDPGHPRSRGHAKNETAAWNLPMLSTRIRR